MCNQCVIEDVKRNMLSRRLLFKGAVLTGAAMAAGSLPNPVLAQTARRVVDLTHIYDSKFPTFDGKPGIELEWAAEIAKDGYQLHKLTIFEHTGTHIDAPLHFSADGASVDQLEPQKLVAPLVIIDITDRAREEANSTVEAVDIERWISANGDIPAGAIVALRSGWGTKVQGPAFRNDEAGKFAFPGFGKSATDLLLERDTVAIGVDTLSLDPGNSADFAVHNSWLPAGRYGIEGLNNLEALPVKGATIVVGAPTHRGGTGGPARILALV
ncbi:cyclase family protein [Neorhizobium sp. T786]|uniref:cyclase family protein n=1 Tax=Pseudorhizobium xiangyangii TaxID=2883104 RepID=UPI001CFFF665|nr:cyclase family protein [Neorhizobium xiangyangii]MCB5203785.1 cyclase family protein [Neorhizobium xiangyangii]